MAYTLRVKRGAKANLPQLMTGELAFTTDAEQLYVGSLSKNIQMQRHLKWVIVTEYGATGDGVTSDTAAVKKAIAALQKGDVLYFPAGTYNLEGEAISIPVENITMTGNATLLMELGFRPEKGGFTAEGLRFEAKAYNTECRAIKVEIPPLGTILKNFTVRNCWFKNFFYAVDFRGGQSTVTGGEAAEGFPIRDVVIENCYSITYEDLGRGDELEKNAGHFQCVQVENISYLNNHTYGGRKATSYNAIKGNGYIRVIGNYDNDNSYGSCEIENASGKVTIQANTFKKKIWIDDSYSAVIDGNVCDDIIHVTVGSNNGNAENIIISDNITKAIRAESFGTYNGGVIKNLQISGNHLNSTATYGVWVQGDYAEFVLVENNIFSGAYTTGKIGVTRGANCEVLLRQNIVKGTVVISGTGGLVYGDRNLGATYNGTYDILPGSDGGGATGDVDGGTF